MKQFINISHETLKIGSMLGKTQAIGVFGELCAAAFYLLAGYQVLSWRRRFGRLEADLVVEKGNRRLLVEVKSGFSLKKGRGMPESKLDAPKVKNLAALARILEPKGGGELSVELLVVDFSKIWPQFRRYPRVCLW